MHLEYKRRMQCFAFAHDAKGRHYLQCVPLQKSTEPNKHLQTRHPSGMIPPKVSILTNLCYPSICRTHKTTKARRKKGRKRAINSVESFIPDRLTDSLTGSFVRSSVEGSTLLRFHSLSSPNERTNVGSAITAISREGGEEKRGCGE